MYLQAEVPNQTAVSSSIRWILYFLVELIGPLEICMKF